MIKENVNHFSLRVMCRMLMVSPSGYYDARDRVPLLRPQANAVLPGKIKGIFDKEHARTDPKRIEKRLRQEGVLTGRHRIAK